MLVRPEDPVQPLGLDERAPGGDVVDERLGGVHEGDVGDVTEGLGGVDAAVAPVGVSYALTDRGTALIPVLEQIALWAQEHLVEDAS
jgi:HxlR-like helix-turn-helix protein